MKKALLRTLLLACSLLSVSFFVYGQPVDSFYPGISYITDRSDLTPAEVEVLAEKGQLTRKDNGYINLGFKESSVWVRIERDPERKRNVLLFENAHLDRITVYYYRGDSLIARQDAGDELDFYTRYYNSNFINFSVPTPTTRILAFVRTRGPLIVPVKLFSYKKFVSFTAIYFVLHGIYLGFILLVLFSAILIFIWLREPLYLYYGAWLFSLALITAVSFGYTFMFLWPHRPYINELNPAFYLTAVFSLLFTEKLLDIKSKSRRIYRVFQVFYGGYALLALLIPVLSYQLYIRMLFTLAFFMPFLSVFAYLSIRKKVESQIGGFFLFGWLIFMISVLGYNFSISGNSHNGLLNQNILQIGSALEILFFNMAILARISTLKKEKENLLSEQNRMLENKVRERTMELEEKNVRISLQNEKLHLQQEELETQRDTLEENNLVIEEKNKLLENQHTQLEQLVEERTRELVKKNEQLEDKNLKMEQYTNIINHNLRAPVATLLGLANIYNEKEPADPVNGILIQKTRETILKIDNLTKDLNILLYPINEKEEVEGVKIRSVIANVKKLLKSEIRNNHVLIREHYKPELELEASPVYLIRIFSNLIANSIQFRKEEDPEIEICGEETKNELVIRVKDNGSGIDLTRHESELFVLYKRFHANAGKGFGLYLVRELMHSLGGKVSISSVEGQGTTVKLRFKLRKPKQDEF